MVLWQNAICLLHHPELSKPWVPKKGPVNKQISIWMALGQNASCLLHLALLKLSRRFGGGVISKFLKWGVISRFFWMTGVMSNLLVCWHWRISAYYQSATIMQRGNRVPICMNVADDITSTYAFWSCQVRPKHAEIRVGALRVPDVRGWGARHHSADFLNVVFW